ncbi:MAG: rhodanese-like domain-containing protein [Cyanobacteria bacterium P01_D01_bin.50]
MFYLLQLPIELKFKNVKAIKISEFARWLNEEALPKPLIIDARSGEEYAVSHIKSAQHIDPDNLNLVQLGEVALDTPIVVYCSIGFRSAIVSQKLSSSGYKNVFNLNGGIFQWANQGYPIFQNQHQVEIVHPYNFIWGKLLKSKYRAHIN